MADSHSVPDKSRRFTSSSLFAGAFDQFRHRPSSQIPFLDGLRTIAILLVINGHFSTSFTSRYGENFYSRMSFVANGWIGVDLFFVLSGFFIGGQLWRELWKEGTISIRQFMLRRGLRIWPLYFFTFLCVLVFYWHNAAAKEYGWADLVFLANYFNYGIVLGGWSLSTEEQFYILTPLLLYLFARRRDPKTVRIWLWAILLFIPLMRAAIWIHHTGNFFTHDPALFATIYYKFHTHCDGLIMGLIISNLWVSRSTKVVNKFWRSSLLVLVGFILLLALRHIQHEVLNFTGLAFFFGSLVWFGLNSGTTLFRSRFFYWISRLSFGMYLNHPYLQGPVFHYVLPRLGFFPIASVASQLLGMSILVVLSAAVAFFTFCLVEHPFLNLRTRLLGFRPAKKTVEAPTLQ
ncbi:MULTISPECIES: acyltransferase [Acidobacteriaceae]|uniref:acyltransferase family protein n=1 Tax=Acidobacteriaceae TaxID=204434 RepID=UPI00131D7B38|nr:MULTISPECIES: acyltransferase [Acidobacteriaceae]MDW5267491.1 acyltransferase [Edaphobacter sp.]